MKIIFFLLGLAFLSVPAFSQWEWQNPLPQINSLKSVFFTDANTGYAVGGDYGGCGTILKTSDGGLSWDIIPGVTTNELSSVFFTNSATGYIAGNNGTILKTIDAGLSWSPLPSGTTNYLSSVYFADENTGYAVGDAGTILKTVNGGTNWITESSGTNQHLKSIYFPSSNVGYAVGTVGTILKTINGGSTWTPSPSGTWVDFQSAYFTDGNTGSVVGSYGSILKTTNGGGYPVELNDLSSKSNTLKIYPNPSSTEITIQTSETPTKSQLSISNLSGQELIIRQITQPKTQIDISRLHRGVYFVRLTGDKTVATGKIIRQ